MLIFENLLLQTHATQLWAIGFDENELDFVKITAIFLSSFLKEKHSFRYIALFPGPDRFKMRSIFILAVCYYNPLDSKVVLV